MSALSILALFILISRRMDKPLRYSLLVGLLIATTLLSKSTGSFLLPIVLLAISLSPYSLQKRTQLTVVIGLVAFVIVRTYYFALPETP